MLDGGSLKAQPMGSHLVCFNKFNRCLSKITFLFCKFSGETHYYILENYSDEEIVRQFFILTLIKMGFFKNDLKTFNSLFLKKV
jgi:hypothetical protein